MRFVFWHPKGKADARIVVIRKVETMIAFIDVVGTMLGTIHASPSLIFKKDKFCLNFLIHLYDSIIKLLS